MKNHQSATISLSLVLITFLSPYLGLTQNETILGSNGNAQLFSVSTYCGYGSGPLRGVNKNYYQGFSSGFTWGLSARIWTSTEQYGIKGIVGFSFQQNTLRESTDEDYFLLDEL